MTIQSKFLNLFLLSTFIFFNSCSHQQIESKNEFENNREIASTETDDCRFLIRKMLLSNGKEVERKFTYNRVSKTSYRYGMLKELEERYKRIDSVLDFPQTKDLPIEDAIKVVRDPNEGLLAKVMMIRNAKESIDLTYFTFDQTEASKVLLNELKDAAMRGVKVRILYDTIGSKLGLTAPRVGIPDDLLTLVSYQGRPIVDELGKDTGKNAHIEVVQFNPSYSVSDVFKKWYHSIKNLFLAEDKKIPLDQMAWNNRIHDKILLVDADSPENAIMMTGGRNVSDPYFHLNHDYNTPGTSPVMDIEVIIRGTTKRGEDGTLSNAVLDQYNRIFYARANIHLREIFQKMNEEILEELEKNPAIGEQKVKEKIRLARKELKEMREASRSVLGNKYSENITGKFEEKFLRMKEENYLEEGFENATISVLHEVHNLTHNRNLFRPLVSVDKKVNPNSIRKHIFDEFAQAKKSIDIVSPYFWLDEDEAKQLAKWLSEDPNRKLRVISNSVLSTDNIISQTVVENSFSRLERVMKKYGVSDQVDLRMIGKEDHELLTPNGKVYGFLHGKVYITDRSNVVVSTSNLDPISRDINSEIGVSFKFKNEDSNNLKEMIEFVEFVQSMSTKYNSEEYKRIMKNPNIKGMVLRLKATRWIVEKLGLLHLL